MKIAYSVQRTDSIADCRLRIADLKNTDFGLRIGDLKRDCHVPLCGPRNDPTRDSVQRIADSAQR
jgi:hypothetical protein